VIDGCFYIKNHAWGTSESYDKDGKSIITSLNEESCIAATRWYLKAKQDGFTKSDITYDSTVGGKL
jgi:hypothetical protein